MSMFNNSVATKLTDTLLLPQVATASIEHIINKALALNSNKALSYTALSQKTLTLVLTELSLPLCFTMSGNVTTNTHRIMVRTAAEDSDCTINTSVQTLKKIKANQSLTQLIKDDELDVIGDIKVAQQFASIAQALEIDWQSELAKHLGDVPTHKLLHLGNKVTTSLLSKGKQLESDVSEYLIHEKRLVVTYSQIKNFTQQTQTITKQVDDLAIRIDKLITKSFI